MNGAEILIKTLEEKNIRIVAGIPGGSNLPVYDALAKSNIRHILARHEQGAAFIAGGMARTTGKTAVCFATSGPGATNLLTALADCKADSIPVIAITGQVPSSLLGKDSFQEVDIISSALPLCKHCFFVSKTEEIPNIIDEAFLIAGSGRKGPVLIDIPKDCQMNEYIPSQYNKIPKQPIKTDLSGIKEAARIINSAKRPVIISGGGVIAANAEDELLLMAQKNSIPVSPTLMGLCSFDAENQLNIGFSGMHGARYTNHIINKADLIIAAGSRFGDRSTGKTDEFAPNAKIIHIDIDSTEDGKICPAEIFIRLDAHNFFKEIIPLIENNERKSWLNEIYGIKKAFPLHKYPSLLHPSNIIKFISDNSPDDAIIVTDVGQHQMWTAQRFSFSRKRKLLTSGGLGTMGFGLPSAIGAALAEPDRKVILITGDGSLMMNIQELALLSEIKCDLTIAVMNNGYLGLVRQQQELFYNSNFSACRFENPLSFARIGSAFNIESHETGETDLIGIAGLFSKKGTFIADIKCSPENVLPMVPPGKNNISMIGEEL
ncbi:MAG: biosynthetic-type acetolactate synthase large subunit [Spirochaetes bacterium]|nr:biosynthetic-type acetolactate synthase large subunit [Spirochaetota bacterium]